MIDSTLAPRALTLPVRSAVVAIVLAIGILHGCTATGPGPTSPIVAAGSSFLQCGKQDLTQLIGPQGWTLIATVYDDLSKDNYVQLIADLVSVIGGDAVGCAMVAIESLDKTNGSGSGGSGSGARAITARSTRAAELIAKYNWKIAPPAAK